MLKARKQGAQWGKKLKLAAAIGVAALLCATANMAFAAKTLVFCSEGSPEGFNPQLFTTGTTFDASSVPLYNRLVAFELGTTKIVPALAESWTVSDDGLTYTFKLRKGVKFHSSARFKPSRDFNADDVLFSFNRMADVNHPFHQLATGASFSYFLDMGMDKIVDKVSKADAYTVVFKLKHPEAPFIANLGMDFASILSAEYADKMKAAGTPEVIDREPVGTGPFQFVSYQKDAVIRYKAFDAYWDGRPKLDNLVFAITPDASVRYAKLKANECQVMAFPKPADIELMKADPAITLLSKEGLNVGYISFNVEKKPFDNKLVRQALNLATDKQTILKTVYQGAGQVAKNPIPPTLWSYDNKIQDYAYDPAKAKALLAKAGYPNGVAVELWYLPVTRPYNPDGKRMAELIQADWAKIGVKATLATYEWTEYLKRSKQGVQQAMMFGWSGDNGDPDNFLATLLGCESVRSGGNTARWCDKNFEALIQKAKLTPKQDERAKLYQQAQAMVHEEAPWIPLAHSLTHTPIRKQVIGFKMSAFALHDFSKVDIGK
ncbi:ABC transporter substrate-binding protein [Collimonas sp. OK412]|jgi:dipeptide transport system substrate-binding protein|uniref:ABC transporter substrate-binding protein n=1 Tax=Collimonas sp. (strain OK412) TaxID=1801619 RepID=UPI0008E77B5D|nr:ABC transporter substrate-binding protein [Collimonas sp. OK412]SFB87595.1 dipeptide transport system substrate-binding protein [Collimonas sp. OK412]